MIYFKRLTIPLVVLGSSSLFAGGSYTCSPDNVSVPCEFTGFDVGIQGLYVKPTYNGDFSYFGSSLVNNVLVGQDVSLDWDFGFRIEGSYHFNTGNDINLNWTYFKKATKFTNVIVNGVNVNWEPSYNALNIELGQHVDYGEVKNIRYHGGFQYASIETDITATFNNISPMVDLKYTGFGPRAGLDMSYDIGYDFSVYSNFAGAILVGTSKYTGNVTGIGNTTIQLLRGSSTAIVPELEAKAGIKYNYALYQGDFIFDLGWMWMNYFNAQHLGTGNNETDFGFQGPYATLKFIGGM